MTVADQVVCVRYQKLVESCPLPIVTFVVYNNVFRASLVFPGTITDIRKLLRSIRMYPYPYLI